MVIFSGFDSAHRQLYNYIRQLEGAAPHRMYVADSHGERGCYYLGENRELFVADAVRAAIEHELTRLGLGTERLTTAGSSKGGSAAVYFALALGCRALAGAPQYAIGTYAAASAPGVCELVAGGTGAGDVAWLDRVLPKAIERGGPGAAVSLFSSPADAQYASHVQPMIAQLQRHGVDHDLTMGTYPDHQAVGEQFGGWLRERAHSLCGEGALRRRTARLAAQVRMRVPALPKRA